MAKKISPKEQIEKELAKEKPDWLLIERLSRGVVDANPESVRFSVDAGHIQRLGRELVAKQETALAELIKNAYDADATEVKITFTNHDKSGGTLVIDDNGVGMSSDIVRNAWMCISTDNKKQNPLSELYGRVRAGRKGIGRFAVQRLGTRLILKTEIAGQKKGIRVTFNWDEEFISGQPLNEIFSQVEEYDKPLDREGTRLSISGLREPWNDTAIDRVWKTVLFLQPPFKPSPKNKNSSLTTHKTDPGFKVSINSISSNRKQKELSIKNKFLDHAIATIAGEIYDDGSAEVRVRSLLLDVDESQEYKKKYLATGALSFTVRYFIYQPETLSGLSFATATEMARLYGGIRIYRNGFRVSPYGEPSDDWLGLDSAVGRREFLAPGNNRNFFGQVNINDRDNILFEETSSREGLIENDAFEDLREFVRSSVEWAIKRIAAARHRKQTSGQKGFVSKVVRNRKSSEVIDVIAKDLVNTIQGNRQTPELDKLVSKALTSFDAVKAEVKQLEDQKEEEKAASIRYEEMLRVLASLGLSISVFGHEIKGMHSSVSASVSVLKKDILKVGDSGMRSQLVASLSELQDTTGRMFDLGGYVAGVMSKAESRKRESLSVKGAVEKFVKQFRSYMERQGITFTVDIFPENLRTMKMHPSELVSVLLNFLTNSIKSIKKSKVSPRNIRIYARRDNQLVLLGFEDNGGGVSPEIANRIFDPFFTTTLDIEDDEVAGPGTGLGLKIVSDIANSYGGGVCLGAPSDGYNCCFEFRVLSSTAHKGEEE